MLRFEDRQRVVEEIKSLVPRFPKLIDMIPRVLDGYMRPPQNPDECIFAKTTACVSSDLKRKINPCQYGGDPDCTQCGCMASVGLEAVGNYKLGGVVKLKTIFGASIKVGELVAGAQGRPVHRPAVAITRPEPSPTA
jgi:hypothetical protein